MKLHSMKLKQRISSGDSGRHWRMRNTLMEMHSMKLKSSLSFSNKLRQTLQYRE